jgi:hypothetical protein
MEQAIDFSVERWARVKEAHAAWWANELERPLVHVTLQGAPSRRASARHGFQAFTSFYPDTVSPGEVVDSWEAQLAQCRWLGDGYPGVFPNWGPGVLAAFLGCHMENGVDTVWFHPPDRRELQDLQLVFDPANPAFRRVRDVMAAAARRWGGLVQVGMTDIGGNLDVVSSFRPSEQLLLDLYDCPDEVRRLGWEVHRTWWQAFEALVAATQPNPGYSTWCPVFSDGPMYILQCDFCYMIGPEMFDEFVKPELVASAKRLKNSIYHLDGPGQLAHLDSLLTIPELGCVQWIPGAGQPGMTQWPEVYRKIHAAGKKIQVYGLDALDAVARQIGTARGIVAIVGGSVEDEPAIRERLRKYDVEPC